MVESFDGDLVRYDDHVAALAAMTERAERAERYVDGQNLRSDYRTATEMRAALERAEKANAVLRAECEAWREWNDRDPHEPDRGIEDIENARAATDAAVALKGVE